MQEHEVRALLEQRFLAMDPDLEYEGRTADYMSEFPQSGERFDRDGLRRLQQQGYEAAGAAPRLELRRVWGAGDHWVSEGVIRYADGTVMFGVALIEFREDKIARDIRYFCEPFEVPSWRADWSRPATEPVAG